MKIMNNKIRQIEEGDIFSINLDENIWTVGQLCNLFTLNKRYSQYTMAFFNHKFESVTEITEAIHEINLKNPIAIFTINKPPSRYKQLNFIGKREIAYDNASDYKKDISSNLGMYKNFSTDFENIIKAFFGLFPWDGFGLDDYVDQKLIKGTERRSDVKLMKDFSIEELKNLLDPDNIKLKQLIRSNVVIGKKNDIQEMASLEELFHFKPTLAWLENISENKGIYSPSIVDEVNKILDDFINQLKIEQEKAKLRIKSIVKETVLQLNKVNEQNDNFIETDEREELCEFFEQAIKVIGIATNEDMTEEWRNW